jgi:hypothetical protein
MWEEPGKLIDLKTPGRAKKEPLSVNDLKKISKAWLYAAPWIQKDSVIAPFIINGVPAGTIDIKRRTMSASPFWNKTESPINESALSAIKMKNEIIISNTEGGEFGLAHIFLLVQFSDGRFAKSDIAQKVLTSFKPTEGGYPDFPAAELIESADTESPLANIYLRFKDYY